MSFLPLTIFGVLSILAAVLVPVLPETKDKPLPETIEDAVHLGRTPPSTCDRDRKPKMNSKHPTHNEVEEDPV